MILVIAEQRDGALNQASLETVAAAQQMSDLVQGPVKVVIAGGSVSGLSGVLAAADVAEVLTVESEALASYTVDGFVDALAQVIAGGGTGSRAVSAHLPDTGLCSQAGDQAEAVARHRLYRR